MANTPTVAARAPAQTAFDLLNAFTPSQPSATSFAVVDANAHNPPVRRRRISTRLATPRRPTPEELEVAAIAEDRKVARRELDAYLSVPCMKDLPPDLLEYWVVSSLCSVM
jgi:hypothetical protein